MPRSPRSSIVAFFSESLEETAPEKKISNEDAHHEIDDSGHFDVTAEEIITIRNELASQYPEDDSYFR